MRTIGDSNHTIRRCWTAKLVARSRFDRTQNSRNVYCIIGVNSGKRRRPGRLACGSLVCGDSCASLDQEITCFGRTGHGRHSNAACKWCVASFCCREMKTPSSADDRGSTEPSESPQDGLSVWALSSASYKFAHETRK